MAEGNLIILGRRGGSGGTTDYNELTNKPTLNGETIQGAMTTDWWGTKEEFDALAEKDPKVTYHIEGESASLKRKIVGGLPTENIDTNTIYMVLKSKAETNNIYDEYMYIENAWEKIGDTSTDLTNYYTKTQVDGLVPTKTSQLSNDSGYINSVKTINNQTITGTGNVSITEGREIIDAWLLDPNDMERLIGILQEKMLAGGSLDWVVRYWQGEAGDKTKGYCDTTTIKVENGVLYYYFFMGSYMLETAFNLVNLTYTSKTIYLPKELYTEDSSQSTLLTTQNGYTKSEIDSMIGTINNTLETI